MNKTVINKLEMGYTKEAKQPTLRKIAKAFGLELREMEDMIPGGSVRLDVPEPVQKRKGATRSTAEHPAVAKKRA